MLPLLSRENKPFPPISSSANPFISSTSKRHHNAPSKTPLTTLTSLSTSTIHVLTAILTAGRPSHAVPDTMIFPERLIRAARSALMAGSMARKRTMMPVSARQALAELPRPAALAELPTLPLVAVLLTVALAGKSSYPEWVLMKAAMRRAKRTCRANMSASPERP
jgi:hypothetical protein